MTKVVLLEQLKDFTMDVTRDLLLPVAQQKEDREPPADRAAAVYRMRLPDSRAATKKAPYILHQALTNSDIQPPGQRPKATATIRTIFCVYHKDEQEGSLALLNLMERLRIALLEQVVIGKQFKLNLEAGLEGLVYQENTAPYYAGEMISTWKLPVIEREVNYGEKGNSGIRQPGPGPGCGRSE
ncbi:MAG: hypothetical protein K2P26_07180 [Oscillospiraceae bacterium]|nr:hypothetical protein [Oscillospiraceae bacterium]